MVGGRDTRATGPTDVWIFRDKRGLFCWGDAIFPFIELREETEARIIIAGGATAKNNG